MKDNNITDDINEFVIMGEIVNKLNEAFSHRIPRDPERIDKLLNKIRTIWKKFPDMRLCQLIGNCFNDNDVYNKEDSELRDRLSAVYVDAYIYDAYPDGWTCVSCGEEFFDVLPSDIEEGTVCSKCVDKEE